MDVQPYCRLFYEANYGQPSKTCGPSRSRQTRARETGSTLANAGMREFEKLLWIRRAEILQLWWNRIILN
jgi:hypothetical protein